MSAPPLSAAAYEVLRALVLGLELRETSQSWAFVGPWQIPARSGVPGAVMDELLSGGFVRRGNGSCAELTAAGIEARYFRTQETLETALRWNGLPLDFDGDDQHGDSNACKA